MYKGFKNIEVKLEQIRLDDRNPRLITQQKLSTEEDIVAYLFEHESLSSFIKIIAAEGRNPGAERPYVVKDKRLYVVVEGNTRVAAYKLLTGMLTAPEKYKNSVPPISRTLKNSLLTVDVSVAPNRDSLMPIMARAHFGLGDKSRWRYLGSRKALYEEWVQGKSIQSLADTFNRTQGSIREFLVEYLLYLEALKLPWTPAEKEELLRPKLEFNPPVRFLQTTGHKEQVGVELDRLNIKIKFLNSEAKDKLKHLIKRTVLENSGPTATASYAEVFSNYNSRKGGVDPSKEKTSASNSTSKKNETDPADGASHSAVGTTPSDHSSNSEPTNSDKQSSSSSVGSNILKPHRLFSYDVTRQDLTLKLLMKEAKGLNVKSYPGAGTALLRGIIEVILKLIIEEKKLNSNGTSLALEGAVGLIINKGNLQKDDLSIVKEFNKSHLSYLNLSTHATLVPNYHRLIMVRDCIDSFVKRNI